MTYKLKKESKFFLKKDLFLNSCLKFSKFANFIPSSELILFFLEHNAIALNELLPINTYQINNKPSLISIAANN